MTNVAAVDFYSTEDRPPQQGDILLGSVSRVVASDRFAPQHWRTLDEHHSTLASSSRVGSIDLPALEVVGGRALVMVCSHDCGLDKEFNAVVHRHQLDDEAAVAAVEARPDLDRNFTVSPLVAPDAVVVAGEPVDRQALMAGRVIGYLPVPALELNGRVVIPESVVDLSYRATIDRFSYTQRLTCISESARERLRYALARLDVLRTPTLETQLEAVVGQTITSVAVSRKNPLMVDIRLADGTTIQLLQKPGSPPVDPPARTRRSVRGATDTPTS